MIISEGETYTHKKQTNKQTNETKQKHFVYVMNT